MKERYSPMIQNALVKWYASAITAILDTPQLWGEYCLIRLSVHYRGRAVPRFVARDSP